MSNIKWQKNPKYAKYFGTFYEEILRQYFEKNLDFRVDPHKPSVPLGLLQQSHIRKRKSPFIDSMKNAFNSHKSAGRKRYLLDFFLESNHGNFLVEAKVKPKGGVFSAKQRSKYNIGVKEKDNRLTWGIAQLYFLDNMPWLLADKAIVGGKQKDVQGKCFVFHQRTEDHQKIVTAFSQALGQKFEIFYMTEIIDELQKSQEEWYTDLIKEEKHYVERFFDQLLF